MNAQAIELSGYVVYEISDLGVAGSEAYRVCHMGGDSLPQALS